MSAESRSEIDDLGPKVLNLVISTMKENALENLSKSTPKLWHALKDYSGSPACKNWDLAFVVTVAVWLLPLTYFIRGTQLSMSLPTHLILETSQWSRDWYCPLVLKWKWEGTERSVTWAGFIQLITGKANLWTEAICVLNHCTIL